MDERRGKGHKKEEGKVSTFNFLGFTYYCDKTRKGTFKVGCKTNPKEDEGEAEGNEPMAQEY